MTCDGMLQIADVRFVVSCATAEVRQPACAAQRAFTGVAGGVGADRVCVRLELERMPDISHLPAQFIGAESWTLHRDGQAHWLGFGAGEGGSPWRWLAHWDRAVDPITLYCSRDTYRAGDGDDAVWNPLLYPLDQHLLVHYLAEREGLLVHAAGLSWQGRGLLFPGRSGAGKTTIVRQFLQRGCQALLSDDRVVVRRRGGQHLAYGTPWPGEAGIAVDASVPLAAIFFIAHGPGNLARPLSPQAALERLLPLASILWFDREKVLAMTATLESLVRNVPAFELQCRPTPAVVDYLASFLDRSL